MQTNWTEEFQIPKNFADGRHVWMVSAAIARALVIHLAIGSLEPIGASALVVVRVAAATEGAAPAAVLTRPRRAWIKFDIAEGTCGRQTDEAGEKLGRFACFDARPRNLN